MHGRGNIRYSECLSVALDIRQARCKSPIILSSVVCLAVLYICTLSHERHDYRYKRILLNTKYVYWFSPQNLSEMFLILSRTERDMILYVYRSSCKVPVILVRFSWKLNFLGKFSKKRKLSDSQRETYKLTILCKFAPLLGSERYPQVANVCQKCQPSKSEALNHRICRRLRPEAS